MITHMVTRVITLGMIKNEIIMLDIYVYVEDTATDEIYIPSEILRAGHVMDFRVAKALIEPLQWIAIPFSGEAWRTEEDELADGLMEPFRVSLPRYVKNVI